MSDHQVRLATRLSSTLWGLGCLQMGWIVRRYWKHRWKSLGRQRGVRTSFFLKISSPPPYASQWFGPLPFNLNIHTHKRSLWVCGGAGGDEKVAKNGLVIVISFGCQWHHFKSCYKQQILSPQQQKMLCVLKYPPVETSSSLSEISTTKRQLTNI